jgi:hypothetical protein
MVSNFGVSFKLKDIREAGERCIGSSLSSSKGTLPQEENPTEHKLLQTLPPSTGRLNKPSGGLSVTGLISRRKNSKHWRSFVKPVHCRHRV